MVMMGQVSLLKVLLPNNKRQMSFFEKLQPQKENNNAVPHQLIGSTSERNILSSEIDRAFTESLNSDIRKEMELRYTDNVNTKAVDLQSSRIPRVVPEPGLTDPHVYIAVRRASKIRNLGTRFFVHLITSSRTRSYTSHVVHLK